MLDSFTGLPLPMACSSSTRAFDSMSGFLSNSVMARSSVVEVVSVPATNKSCDVTIYRSSKK